MEQKPKVRIYDSGFTPYVKSASLREENKDVSPAYFEWWHTKEENQFEGMGIAFYTGGSTPLIDDYHINKILWLTEPRCLYPGNYDRQDISFYNTILTYDKELLEKYPDKARFYPLGGSSIAFEKWGMYPKTKDICMILSDKKTTGGHKLRHEIYEKYKDSGLIDFYGAGAGKPFESKFEILKDYRYCIVVESCDIDYYWTEKLIDCLSVGTIPIYNGTPITWEGIFNRLGFCAFYEFDELKCILEGIEDSKNRNHILFNSSDLARQNNLEKAKSYRICEDWIYTKYPELFND